MALLVVGCTSQQSAPVDPFEPTSQLDYHDGYWVAKMDVPDRPVSLTVINDMHIDAATNCVTVYAQSRLLGKVVAPPQVGPAHLHWRTKAVDFAGAAPSLSRAQI